MPGAMRSSCPGRIPSRKDLRDRHKPNHCKEVCLIGEKRTCTSHAPFPDIRFIGNRGAALTSARMLDRRVCTT